MNSHEAKLKFLLHVTKHGLQSFDTGGDVTAQSVPNLSVQPSGTSAVNLNASNPNTGIIGTVGNALGLTNNFQAAGANTQAGTNVDQLNRAYNEANEAMTGQKNLANTLAPQASNAVGNQNILAAQLLARTRGQGPSVAETQLNQATGKNVANTAALMSGQRGASANPALIARQAAMAGADVQQQGAAQAATLRAQEQLAAQNQLQNLAANQISQTGQSVNNLTNAQQAEQNILQGANSSYNNAAVGMQSNINNTNAETAKSNQGLLGGLFGGIASGLSSIFGAEGGQVVLKEHPIMMAKGGEIRDGYLACMAAGGPIGGNSVIVGNPLASAASGPSAPASFAGQFLSAPAQSSGPNVQQMGSSPQTLPDFNKIGNDVGDMVNGFRTRNPSDVSGGGGMASNAMAKGGKVQEHLAAKGGKVKADSKKQKAKVSGNSYANDSIPALLSEGEIVLPRSVTQHANAPEMAKRFVMQVQARKKAGGKL